MSSDMKQTLSEGRSSHVMTPTAPKDDLATLVEDAERSLRFPHAALRLARLAYDPKTNAQEIAHLIERDPALAARVLRLANSPLFPYEGQVADLHRAISMIGLKELTELALAAACVSGFGPMESELLRRADFWWHSFSCALLAQDLARAFGQTSEEAFAAGLLHDVGQMLLFSRRSQIMVQVLHDSLSGDVTLPDLERQHFGFDHADLGGALLRSWKLPERLCEAVALHHHPAADLEQKPLARIVQLANLGAGAVTLTSAGSVDALNGELCARLGYAPPDLAAYLDANRKRADGFCAGLGL